MRIARKTLHFGALFCLLSAPCVPLQAKTFSLPTPDLAVIGENSFDRVGYKETLLDVAYRHNMGIGEIRLANPGVDTWLPEVDSVLVPAQFILPAAPRHGVVVNLAEKRLYYYPPGENEYRVAEVVTHPISIGRRDWKTPVGTTRIVERLTQPSWYPPPSVKAEYAARGERLPVEVPPGPDNPLGDHALLLGMPGYLIHGTNKPFSIGMRVSHGCIRLYPEDIASLFDRVKTGTTVRIVDQPYKAAVHSGNLYIEVHPLTGGEGTKKSARPLLRLIRKAVDNSPDITLQDLDWFKVREVFRRADGVAHPVTYPPAYPDELREIPEKLRVVSRGR